jgi:hypothetical protein
MLVPLLILSALSLLLGIYPTILNPLIGVIKSLLSG